MVFIEEQPDRVTAMKRELAIKAMGRQRKMNLVRNGGRAGK
jgi:predicted GIY-YIG superfamily endonuclease